MAVHAEPRFSSKIGVDPNKPSDQDPKFSRLLVTTQIVTRKL